MQYIRSICVIDWKIFVKYNKTMLLSTVKPLHDMVFKQGKFSAMVVENTSDVKLYKKSNLMF
jgi:hypothetical protein